MLVLSTLGGYIGRFVIEKDMPFYCVAANCTNKACLKDGIFHTSMTNTRKLKDEEKYGWFCMRKAFVFAVKDFDCMLGSL
jgi:hypothetical protein